MSENKRVDPLEDTRAESIRPGKLIAGAPIGGYHLETVLGEGGMGIVWSARDPLLDRTIAIKVLKSRDAHHSMRTRLQREAQAMARLKHPNVLTVHEVGTEGDRDFIVMELVDGGPLDHWLAFGPPFEEVMAALLAAGRGLAAAHAAGLVHRDFKPNNVLRSKDGRVLVTDFGLARGLGDDWQNTSVTASGAGFEAVKDQSIDPVKTPATIPERTPSIPGRRDNVLDSPLTRTGAMIGTPAYMAPEQFAGSEPDPRTDQFSYCVTAWQALTGARPFFGRTIDELRQAAGGGVAMVVADLAKPIRTVLTRGLDPDPAKRWPDLVTLLRELEAAAKPRKKRWPLVAGAAAVVIAIALVIGLTRRGGIEPTCEPVEAAWGDAWSDTHKLPESAQWIGPVLEDHRRRWIAAYDQTCKSRTRAEGRLGCLRAVRDRVAVVAQLARDPSTHAALDPFVLLAPPEACSGRPIAIPAFPDDDRRARVLTVLAKSIATPSAPNLDGDAKASGWTPLVSMVQTTTALDHIRRGAITPARDGLERVVVGSETNDPRLAAIARLALLEASLRELAGPEDKPGTKSETMHAEITRLLAYARSAIKAAGDEPLLAGVLAFLEAEALADLAERAPRKVSYDEALKRVTDARKAFELAGDVRRLARSSALYAEIQLRRGDTSVLADAEFVARSAAEALDRAKLPPVPALDDVLGRIAFLRNDARAAHRWFDRSVVATPVTGELVEGIVLDPEGKPVMNAVVVTWTGELHGDPVRAFTDRRSVRGEIVETAAEGKFKIHRSVLGAAIVAESGMLRSLPQVIGTDKLVLQLAPATELAGKVETRDSSGLHAYVRYTAGPHGWFVHAPVDRDQAFRITGLPRAAVSAGVIARSGTGTRRKSSAVVNLATDTALKGRLAWPTGGFLDVIVRGKTGDGARVWVCGHTLEKLATRLDVEVHISNAMECAAGPLSPIGSRITDAGRQAYLAGDRHAVFVGDFGWACVAPTDAATAKVACKPLDDKSAIVIEIP